MTFKSVGIIGTFLLALAASGPAQAFSGESDNSSSSSAEPADSPAGQPSANYRYSGNGFNFSMSKTPAEQNNAPSAPEADAQQAQPSRARPNYFQRTMRSIFGD